MACATEFKKEIFLFKQIQKQYLNPGKRLSELFQVVKELEKMEISRMKNDVERFRKKERKEWGKTDIIVTLQET